MYKVEVYQLFKYNNVIFKIAVTALFKLSLKQQQQNFFVCMQYYTKITHTQKLVQSQILADVLNVGLWCTSKRYLLSVCFVMEKEHFILQGIQWEQELTQYGWQSQYWPCHTADKQRMFLMFLNIWGKCAIHYFVTQIQVSLPINTLLSEHRHIHSLMICVLQSVVWCVCMHVLPKCVAICGQGQWHTRNPNIREAEIRLPD